MTLWALCGFLDITTETWGQYRNKRALEENTDYTEIELKRIRDHNAKAEVVTRVGMYIKAQKFEGACLEIFNPNIIARDLHLRDLKTLEHSGIDGAPIKSEITVNLQPVSSSHTKK